MQDPIATENVVLTKRFLFKLTRDYPIKNKEAIDDVLPEQEQKNTHKCGAVITRFTSK